MALTQQERELLQRLYDDDLSELEAKRAQKFIETSESARLFIESLDETSEATRLAEEEAWSKTDPPTSKAVAEYAVNAPDLASASLEELAPVLERFFDGEATDEEAEVVASLIDEREDIAEYIMGLEELRVGVLASSQAAGEMDFAGFWDSIETQIDAEQEAFDAEEHRVLVYRFFDGEVSNEEIGQVNGWVDEGVNHVVGAIDAMKEVKFAVNVSVEEAQEGVDFSSIWEGVEDVMDAELEARGENIVAFGRAKKAKEERGFFARNQQSVFSAVAALLVLGIVGIFGEQIVGPRETVIVQKTVVIVDSVEYEPGTSVMINSPVEQASAISTPEAEEAPTVIWLLDSEDDDSIDDAESQPGDEPAGDEDAGYRGKPI